MRDLLTAEDRLLLGAVVKISALPSGAGAVDVSTEHGSGFILSNGLIITNKHVVEDGNEGDMVRVTNHLFDFSDARICVLDPANDLAILYSPQLISWLRAEENAEKCSLIETIPEEKTVDVGDAIVVFGFPATSPSSKPLLTSGYVSGVHESPGFGKPEHLILNCPLNHGNSGGPVLRKIGERFCLIGVAKSKHFTACLTHTMNFILQTISKPDFPQGTTWTTTDESGGVIETKTEILLGELYKAIELNAQHNLAEAVPTVYLNTLIAREMPRKLSGLALLEVASTIGSSDEARSSFRAGR